MYICASSGERRRCISKKAYQALVPCNQLARYHMSDAPAERPGTVPGVPERFAERYASMSRGIQQHSSCPAAIWPSAQRADAKGAPRCI
eukprot:8620337-Pyramimonas_sp.AAC.2